MLLIAYFLSAVAILLMAAAFAYSVRVMTRFRSWAETEAEIVDSSVESFVDTNHKRMYRGMYQLRYHADRDIREALVRSEVALASKDDAAKAVAARPPGSRVRIHYDPDAPGQVATNLGTGFWAHTNGLCLALLSVAFASVAAALWFAGTPPAW